MAPYQYFALDEDASEIRLMTLLPGEFQDDIFITLETVTLTRDHVPHYETLSYVWGSPKHPRTIFIESPEAEPKKPFGSLSLVDNIGKRRLLAATLSITQNLAEALKYLRYKDRPRVLWIDAICVNQQDVAERGHQVKRMAALYSLANQVIVWLGPERQNSTLALRTIEEYGSRIRVKWGSNIIYSASTGEVLPAAKCICTPDTPWQSIRDLLGRPWFERLWIWQEVRLAKRAYIFCGDEGVPWESFRNGMTYLYGYNEIEGLAGLIERGYRIADYVAESSDGLEWVLDQTRSASCSDLRDKVFAVLNLASEHHTGDLYADYSKSTEAVYQDVVLHYTLNLKSLDILIHCELRDEIDARARTMPTWVPDWSVPRSCAGIPLASACKGSRSRVRYQGDGILAATGICIAQIVHVETLPHAEPITGFNSRRVRKMEDALRALLLPKVNALSLSQRDVMINSICRTLCANIFSECYSPPNLDYSNFESTRNYMSHMLETTYEAPLRYPVEISNWYGIVSIMLVGRLLFTTNDGYIGLAPKATKLDDQICILLGCRTPLVLRPNGAWGYEVVGECYIDGFMDGAAYLGSLPGKWQKVQRSFQEYSGRFLSFLDHESGEFQIEDPRLDPLPAGWSIGNHRKESALNLYVNDETGEKTWKDPRMTPEALAARGVDMKEFELI